MNIGKAARLAKQVGMFLLVDQGRWMFYDVADGRLLLTWFRDRGRMTSPSAGEVGRDPCPFAALKVAKDIASQRRLVHPETEARG